ncbi:hypothetical protein BU23DRAFT_91212 [Bimuria novae-zelandiae CBS 107.79]|uniref:HTH psq-type domain-containing protein n=1 Tax=Bimuria novae-zelandiae CBS 107.79 TaxID=1447943 RepID=A0A6A5VCC8_9PLEO|nr:hypothetical protein BU23DRAFT_91212 [Bimuria novae-zelandiae CBS 107.79]
MEVARGSRSEITGRHPGPGVLCKRARIVIERRHSSCFVGLPVQHCVLLSEEDVLSVEVQGGEVVVWNQRLARVPCRDSQCAATLTRHPNRCSTSTLTRRISTNMDPIEAAIIAIDSREPRETFLYRKIAEEFGVVRSTLTR